MPEAIVHVTFNGSDTLHHQMTQGTHAEAVAIASEVYETYVRLLRTGLGTMKNVTIDIDVVVNGERIVRLA